MTAFLALVSRDLRLALRQSSDAALVVAFFVLAVVLFPFGVGPEPQLLARIAAGVVWVTALLAALLSLDRLFQQDYEDGSLEVIAYAAIFLALGLLVRRSLLIGVIYVLFWEGAISSISPYHLALTEFLSTH